MMNRCVCIVYVSEGLRSPIINRLKNVASSFSNKCLLAHSFTDEKYNRTSFFLVGSKIINTAIAVCNEAINSIDFSTHQGTHPTLGVVDHVCFFPLGNTPVSYARESAISFAEILCAMQPVPVYFYGNASEENKELREIRRAFNYFSNDESIKRIDTMPMSPNAGASIIQPNIGITCVGAVPFVQNFNIRFSSINSSKSLISEVTKFVREEKVEALTLPHEDGQFEVACNLLQPSVKTPEYVLEKALEKAKQLGISVSTSYTTGPSEHELLELYDAHNLDE